MPIIESLILARQSIPALTPNRTATITGRNGSSFTFKYTTLDKVIETVIGPLLANGLCFRQDVLSDPNKPDQVGVKTTLYHTDGTTVESETLWLTTDGTTRDMTGKVTTGRRVQLVALLGLAEEEAEVDRPRQQQQQRTQQQSTQRQPQAATTTRDWDALRKAAALGAENGAMSADLYDRVTNLRYADESGDPMPTVPGAGKTYSMYSYLLSLIDKDSNMAERMLSFMFMRVITEQTPPNLGARYLIDRLKAKEMESELDEVRRLITENG